MEAPMPADFAKNPTHNEMGYPIGGIFSIRRGEKNADTASIREKNCLGPRSDPLFASAGEPSYHEACLCPPLSPFHKNGTGVSEKRF